MQERVKESSCLRESIVNFELSPRSLVPSQRCLVLINVCYNTRPSGQGGAFSHNPAAPQNGGKSTKSNTGINQAVQRNGSSHKQGHDK